MNYLTPTTILETILAWTPLGWLIRFAAPEEAEEALSDHKRSALAVIANTVPLIDKLAGEWFEAAKTGVPASDGTATWTEWRRKALLIADSLKAYVQYQQSASIAFNAPRLLADLVISFVNCTTNPLQCAGRVPEVLPWWVNGLGIGAALLGGAYVYNTFVR